MDTSNAAPSFTKYIGTFMHASKIVSISGQYI